MIIYLYIVVKVLLLLLNLYVYVGKGFRLSLYLLKLGFSSLWWIYSLLVILLKIWNDICYEVKKFVCKF